MEEKDTQIITLLTAQDELANIAKDFIRSEQAFKEENSLDYERYRRSMWCWIHNLETSIQKFKDGLV